MPASSAPASEAPDDVGDVDAEDVDYVAALLEREAFFGEQQQPLDSAILTAATDAQRQFIAEQRAYTESRGGEWSAEAETIALAVSLDACESAILNGHRFAAENFRAHLVTSPLFHDLAGDDPQRQQGLTQIMLTGMSFLCPDDAPQWDEASREVLGP